MSLTDKAREARNKAQREWRRKNPDKVRQYQKNWSKRNPEYLKDWFDKNPDKKRQYQESYWNRIAERMEAESVTVTDTDTVTDTVTVTDRVCVVCGVDISHKRKGSVYCSAGCKVRAHREKLDKLNS